MRLLFDQNISFRIVRKIRDIFPDAKQVRELGLENAKDSEIYEYAKMHNYVIITFDIDFYNIVTLKGAPPKIIWIRSGNLRTSEIEKLLRKNIDLIKIFIDGKYDCLEIS